MVTQMDFVINSLRQQLYSSDFQLLGFNSELSRLKHMIHTLAVEGESNSILIIGRRGSGKNHLVLNALRESKQDKNVEQNLLVAHLNGLIHTDDRSALYSMAKQLHYENLPQLDASFDEENMDTDAPSLLPFSKQLQWFLDGLRSGGKSCKSLLIVLQEFDLFALHRNQILLYNLFDSCQCSETPIGVIGLTCRLDVMELLEKRVKSRFSHNQIFLPSLAAPTDPDDDRNVETDSSPAFERFCGVFKHFLTVNTDEKGFSFLSNKERQNIRTSITAWNKHIENILEEEFVKDTLKTAWMTSVDLRRLVNLIIPLVSSLGPDKQRIEAYEVIDALCSLRLDAKVNSLKGLCVLELILVATLLKLQEISTGKPVNFEIVYTEYAKFCRSNCPNYLYEKPVVFKALDNLIDLELIVTGREAAGASMGSSTDPTMKRTYPNTSITLPNYRPLYCFVNRETLSSCLDAYAGCPVELSHWVHSLTF